MDGAPEPAALRARRQTIFSELRTLCDGGLSLQAALSLLRLVTQGDATFLTRTVGIPAADQASLDSDLLSFLISLLQLPSPLPAHAQTRLFSSSSQVWLGPHLSRASFGCGVYCILVSEFT